MKCSRTYYKEVVEQLCVDFQEELCKNNEIICDALLSIVNTVGDHVYYVLDIQFSNNRFFKYKFGRHKDIFCEIEDIGFYAITINMISQEVIREPEPVREGFYTEEDIKNG